MTGKNGWTGINRDGVDQSRMEHKAMRKKKGDQVDYSEVTKMAIRQQITYE